MRLVKCRYFSRHTKAIPGSDIHVQYCSSIGGVPMAGKFVTESDYRALPVLSTLGWRNICWHDPPAESRN
jgi:hypothetical protein